MTAADMPSWVIEASKSLGDLIEYVDIDLPNLSPAKKSSKAFVRIAISVGVLLLGLISFERQINGLIYVGIVSSIIVCVLLFKKAKALKSVTQCAVYSKGLAFGSKSSERFDWEQLNYISHWHYEFIDDYDENIYTVLLKRGGGWEIDDRILGDKAQALAQLISQTGNIPIKPNTQQKNSGLKF